MAPHVPVEILLHAAKQLSSLDDLRSLGSACRATCPVLRDAATIAAVLVRSEGVRTFRVTLTSLAPAVSEYVLITAFGSEQGFVSASRALDYSATATLTFKTHADAWNFAQRYNGSPLKGRMIQAVAEFGELFNSDSLRVPTNVPALATRVLAHWCERRPSETGPIGVLTAIVNAWGADPNGSPSHGRLLNPLYCAIDSFNITAVKELIAFPSVALNAYVLAHLVKISIHAMEHQKGDEVAWKVAFNQHQAADLVASILAGRKLDGSYDPEFCGPVQTVIREAAIYPNLFIIWWLVVKGGVDPGLALDPDLAVPQSIRHILLRLTKSHAGSNTSCVINGSKLLALQKTLCERLPPGVIPNKDSCESLIDSLGWQEFDRIDTLGFRFELDCFMGSQPRVEAFLKLCSPEQEASGKQRQQLSNGLLWATIASRANLLSLLLSRPEVQELLTEPNYLCILCDDADCVAISLDANLPAESLTILLQRVASKGPVPDVALVRRLLSLGARFPPHGAQERVWSAWRAANVELSCAYMEAGLYGCPQDLTQFVGWLTREYNPLMWMDVQVTDLQQDLLFHVAMSSLSPRLDEFLGFFGAPRAKYLWIAFTNLVKYLSDWQDEAGNLVGTSTPQRVSVATVLSPLRDPMLSSCLEIWVGLLQEHGEELIKSVKEATLVTLQAPPVPQQEFHVADMGPPGGYHISQMFGNFHGGRRFGGGEGTGGVGRTPQAVYGVHRSEEQQIKEAEFFREVKLTFLTFGVAASKVFGFDRLVFV